MKTVNGVITTSSTVLSVTCEAAPVVRLPGGMFGPSTKMTSGRTIAVPITVSAPMRPRGCAGSCALPQTTFTNPSM